MAHKLGGNFLWFAEADVEESQDALMVPASAYLGCDMVTGGVNLFFEDIEGGATRETVKLSCANGNQKTVMDALCRIMQAHPHGGGKMIVVADYNVANSQTAIGAHSEFGGLVTAVTIT
tara:strand:+ start:149 stop:505 length:357 start_codon:yes stop_codon:yes gene_type:complete